MPGLDQRTPLSALGLIAVIAGIAVAALGLAACGGSGSSSSTDAATSAPAPAAETKPAEAETKTASEAEATASGGGGGSPAGGLTPPGTELEPGQPATVAWVPPGNFEPEVAQTGIELEATVESIEEGSVGDLKNIELEPKEQGAVPFYVRLKLTALGDQSVPAEEDPAYSFEAIDDREQEQPSVTFLGTFKPCEDVEMPKRFVAGASYETCLTYLMKGGGSIEKVEWTSGPAKANEVTPYFEHPIVWSAPGG